MSTEQISLKDLSAADRKELIKQANQIEKAEKQKQDEDRKAYKEIVGEVVPKFFNELVVQSEALSETKLMLFKGVKDLIALKKDAYGIKEGQRSHSLSSADGLQTIKFGYRVNDGWDDTHHAGIDKVNEFINTLITDDNTKKLVKTINKLLQKDTNGNLKSSRVLELEKIAEDWNSDLLNDGIAIIRKSWKPIKSCYFIEAFYLDAIGQKQPVPLNISSVSFPEGTKIDFI